VISSKVGAIRNTRLRFARNVPRGIGKGLVEISGTMYEINEQRETVNMCNAVQELIEEGRKEGRKEEREKNARRFAAYLQTQSMPVRKVRSTLRKWCRLATKDLDRICPLL